MLLRLTLLISMQTIKYLNYVLSSNLQFTLCQKYQDTKLIMHPSTQHDICRVRTAALMMVAAVVMMAAAAVMMAAAALVKVGCE